jgi:transcriptional repressor NrdR
MVAASNLLLPMHCPFCDAEGTRVVDSRRAEGGSAIRRRRECGECGNRFTTYERREAALVVRKRNGSVQAFSAAKVLRGVTYAIADRPVRPGAVEGLVRDVEVLARESGPEVTSDQIGRWVLEGLRRIDRVAYLRFASVYKSFAGTREFQEELVALGEEEE